MREVCREIRKTPVRWHVSTLLIALLVNASTASAQDAPVPIGTLICTLAQSGEDIAAPPSQVRDVACVFRRDGSAVEESYSGKVRRVSTRGQDLTGIQVLGWTVRAPRNSTDSVGALEQVYSGETKASAAANQLVSSLAGDANASITLNALQPADSAPGAVTIVELKFTSGLA